MEENFYETHHEPEPNLTEEYEGTTDAFHFRSDNGVEIWSTLDVSSIGGYFIAKILYNFK